LERAVCVDEEAYFNGFYPGTPCANNWQCMTSNCTSSMCLGQIDDTLCMSHTECDIGYFCDTNSR
jgi:hypothetical protein